MLKKIILALGLLCCFLGVVFAAPKPKVCPSLSELKSVHLTTAYDEGEYTTSAIGKFGSSNWIFMIGCLLAKDDQSAELASKDILDKLNIVSREPYSFMSEGVEYWACNYSTTSPYATFSGKCMPPTENIAAVTPIPNLLKKSF